MKKKHTGLFWLSLLFLHFSSQSRAEVPGLPYEVTQEQNYWCWAALTQAFSAVRGISKTQCQIVNEELNRNSRNSCCNSRLSSLEGAGTCNPRFMADNKRRNQVLGFSALSRSGVLHLNKRPPNVAISSCSRLELRAAPDCKKLNLNDRQRQEGRLTSAEVKTHVEAGRPVGLFYQFGNLAAGHFIWIAGIFDYLGPHGSPRYLINDPLDAMFFNFIGGQRVLTYEQLSNGEVVDFGVPLRAQWIASGVGKSAQDP